MRRTWKGLWNRRGFRLTLAWSGGALVIAALGFLGYMKLVEEGWIKYNKWDRREKGSLQIGHAAPDLELPLLEGETVRLSELWRERPVVLIFGSCT
jgi:hypothetical protein